MATPRKDPTMLRRSTLACVVAAAAALAAAPGASAATIAPISPCFVYVPQLAGEHWVGFTGTGFSQNTDPTLATLRVDYDDGSLGGYSPLAADGSFSPTGFLMPSDFISSKSHIKKYEVGAIDQVDTSLTATTT